MHFDICIYVYNLFDKILNQIHSSFLMWAITKAVIEIKFGYYSHLTIGALNILQKLAYRDSIDFNAIIGIRKLMLQGHSRI